jgi:hypothetical protein
MDVGSFRSYFSIARRLRLFSLCANRMIFIIVSGLYPIRPFSAIGSYYFFRSISRISPLNVTTGSVGSINIDKSSGKTICSLL